MHSRIISVANFSIMSALQFTLCSAFAPSSNSVFSEVASHVDCNNNLAAMGGTGEELFTPGVELIKHFLDFNLINRMEETDKTSSSHVEN